MLTNKWIPSSVTKEVAVDKFIWSTEKINEMNTALDEGINLKMPSPYYDGNSNLRKGNLIFEYTQHELSDIKRCARDISYFAENYCSVMTDDGIQTIKLRDYQKKMLEEFVENRFCVTMASRQVGKTICASIFIAWYVLFNFDKNVMILANKGATTKEIIDKSKVIIENLPFFMKPGIFKYDVMNLRFDNGCRMVGQSTTAKSGISFTIHLLFLDEFAHIHHSILNTFYENVFPTLSSSKVSRVIITSTVNGYNKFYEIYSGAESGTNEFHPIRVDWWQVPGRDEAWKERELNNLGSEEAFNRQYGNQFMATSSILLEGATLDRLIRNKKDFIYEPLDVFEESSITVKDHLSFHPDLDLESIRDSNKFYVFSIDIAEGNGGDYSVINMFQIIPMEKKYWKYVTEPGAIQDLFKLEQIGLFRSNEHIIEDFAKIAYLLSVDLFNSENVKLVIEYNTYGSAFINKMRTVFPKRNEFDDEAIVRFKHRHDARTFNYGIKVKKDNKPILCQSFKRLTEDFRININEEETIKEISTFGKMPNGSYGGQMGNDDIAMSIVNCTEFLNTVDYADFVEELLDTVNEEEYQSMEQFIFKDSDDDGTLNFDIYDLLS